MISQKLDDETIRDHLESHCMDARQTPYRALVRREAHRILREGMDELSVSQQQRIYLHFWEGESYCEIARAEGVDESAVRRSIQRGLAQLKRHLADTGNHHSGLCPSCPNTLRQAHPPQENGIHQATAPHFHHRVHMTEVRGIGNKAVFQEVENMVPINKKTIPEFIALYERALLLALVAQENINEIQFQLCMDQLSTH